MSPAGMPLVFYSSNPSSPVHRLLLGQAMEMAHPSLDLSPHVTVQFQGQYTALLPMRGSSSAMHQIITTPLSQTQTAFRGYCGMHHIAGVAAVLVYDGVVPSALSTTMAHTTKADTCIGWDISHPASACSSTQKY